MQVKLVDNFESIFNSMNDIDYFRTAYALYKIKDLTETMGELINVDRLRDIRSKHSMERLQNWAKEQEQYILDSYTTKA